MRNGAHFEIDAFAWNAAALPQGSERASETGFHGISLSQGTRNLERAWALLKYLAYEREGRMLFTLAENRVPVLKDALAEATNRWPGPSLPKPARGSRRARSLPGKPWMNWPRWPGPSWSGAEARCTHCVIRGVTKKDHCDQERSS